MYIYALYFLNNFSTNEDPASYSNAKSYGTLVGDIYHGWLDPDTALWYFIRFMVMCCLTVLGVWGGIRLQQRFLRNYLHLKLFGYDDGSDPPVSYKVQQTNAA